ncbi:MAG TPA: TlpA disulfide reductase family protein [Pyrinomonadaceae bacterium]|nr:TlpA disulfide reductase family protein [Pyrinomonadaceae bacterium]
MKNLKTFAIACAFALVFVSASFAQTVVPKLDGGTVDVQAQNGKVVVLAIGASWLPLSTKHAEYANALAKKYAGRNVAFYYVVTDSTNARSKNFASDESVQKFVAANRLGMPVLRDSDGATVLKKFKIDQVPSFLILDKTGAAAGEAFGGIDPKFDITVPISRKIDSLL